MRRVQRIAAVFLIILVIVLSGCTEQQEQTVKTMDVQTVYGVLKYPAELEEYLRHDEVLDAAVTIEVFYMLLPEGERELFRIYFGEDDPEGNFGYLTVEDREIPVSYATCEYEKADFPDNANWERYFTMMDGFNIVLQSIIEMPGFSEEKSSDPIELREVALRYWTLELPEYVTCREQEAENVYRAEFYAVLGGEEMPLYTVQLGEPAYEAVLGSYEVEGIPKIVSVESYDSVFEGQWNEEEKQLRYDLMDTINDVILVITESEAFTPGV